MKKLYISVLLLFCTAFAAAQKDGQNIPVITDSEPVFPSGDQALYLHVMNNLSYSEEAKKKYLEGEVMLSFDVKADSSVSNIVLISGVGSGVDEELKKIIGGLKFVPGRQNGMDVKMNTMYTFPVKAH